MNTNFKGFCEMEFTVKVRELDNNGNPIVAETYTDKNGNLKNRYKMVETVTSMAASDFNRLVKYDTQNLNECYSKAKNLRKYAMYAHVDMGTPKGAKNYKKLEKAATEWLEYVGIPCNDEIVGAVIACAYDVRRTKKDGVQTSQMRSRSSFLKDLLYASYNFEKVGKWVGRMPEDYDADAKEHDEQRELMECMTADEKAELMQRYLDKINGTTTEKTAKKKTKEKATA